LLSEKKVKELSQRIHLPDDHADHWVDLIHRESKDSSIRGVAKARVERRLKDSKNSVSLETFRVVSEWYHFAILAFFGANSSFSESELKSRLGIPLAKLRRAIKRLLEVDLLQRKGSGYEPVSETSFAGDQVPSRAIRESHRQILSLAEKGLETIPFEERENQSLFFSLPKKDFEKFSEILRKRVFETVAEFSKDNLEKEDLEVQALTWHLFPINKGQYSDENE